MRPSHSQAPQKAIKRAQASWLAIPLYSAPQVCSNCSTCRSSGQTPALSLWRGSQRKGKSLTTPSSTRLYTKKAAPRKTHKERREGGVEGGRGNRVCHPRRKYQRRGLLLISQRAAYLSRPNQKSHNNKSKSKIELLKKEGMIGKTVVLHRPATPRHTIMV